jgi:hypothetical protein
MMLLTTITIIWSMASEFELNTRLASTSEIRDGVHGYMVKRIHIRMHANCRGEFVGPLGLGPKDFSLFEHAHLSTHVNL